MRTSPSRLRSNASSWSKSRPSAGAPNWPRRPSETLNLAPGDAVREIEVLEIQLAVPALTEEVLRLIDKAIPYHLLFVLACEGQAQAWVGYKEAAATGANAFRVGRYYHTPWMPEDTLRFRLEGLTLDALYESLVRQIAGGTLDAAPAEDLRDTVARDEHRRKLERQIALLEGRLRREKQLNRRLELNTELKKLKENRDRDED